MVPEPSLKEKIPPASVVYSGAVPEGVVDTVAATAFLPKPDESNQLPLPEYVDASRFTASPFCTTESEPITGQRFTMTVKVSDTRALDESVAEIENE